MAARSTLHDVPKFVVFIPNVFHETRNQLDPPMWSLHVEVRFYIVLPLIGSRYCGRTPSVIVRGP